MIRRWLASALYVLLTPVALLYRLFADPIALRRSNRGWHRWPEEEPTMKEAKKPFI